MILKPIFLQELRDKLIAHINDLGQKDPRERERKLKELLQKSFPVVKNKALRPVVMAILRNTQDIDDSYLRVNNIFLFKRFSWH